MTPRFLSISLMRFSVKNGENRIKIRNKHEFFTTKKRRPTEWQNISKSMKHGRTTFVQNVSWNNGHVMYKVVCYRKGILDREIEGRRMTARLSSTSSETHSTAWGPPLNITQKQKDEHSMLRPALKVLCSARDIHPIFFSFLYLILYHFIHWSTTVSG